VIRSFTIVTLVLSSVFFTSYAPAHPVLSDYVQHDITLEASATYLDLTIRLTFFNRLAALQALLLDRDGDGHFDAKEREAFRKDLLEESEEQLTIQVGAAELDLIVLYDPELTISVEGGAYAEHDRFEVRLKFFTRLPAEVEGETNVTIRDGLYPAYPALANIHLAGKEGVRLVAEGDNHDLARPANADTPVHLRGRMTVLRQNVSNAQIGDGVSVKQGVKP